MPEWDIPEDIPDSEGVQGEDSWKEARAGFISASRISDMLAEGSGIVRKKYLTQLAIERLTGKPMESGFKSKAMQRGNELEEDARDLYSFINDVEVNQVGFVKHPYLPNFGASPDGCVGSDGMIEIKCPDLHIHFDYMLNKKIPRPYRLQMQAQMTCTNRTWNDFCSYNPDLPPKLRLSIQRVKRDEKQIVLIENEVIKFDLEINALVEQLRKI